MNVKDAVTLGRATDGCSDVHLIGGDPVKMRVSGRIVTHEQTVSDKEIDSFIEDALGENESSMALFRRMGACDTMAYVEGNQVRLHIHRERRGIRLAIRLTSPNIPKLNKLGLPAILQKWTERSSGLILVCGPSGSGKTTLLAAMIDQINSEDRGAIVTIEKPVEYLHPQRGLYVSQIEVGRDTQSFDAGIRAALQSDPDVLMIGEVNDQDSARVMIQATETGHLVLGSTHAQDTLQALDRIAMWAPAGGLVQLTNALIGVVSLRLVPGIDGGIIPAAEVLSMTDPIRRMIREERFHQIRAVMQGEEGMQTLEDDLKRLVSENLIDRKTAQRYAPRPEEV